MLFVNVIEFVSIETSLALFLSPLFFFLFSSFMQRYESI